MDIEVVDARATEEAPAPEEPAGDRSWWRRRVVEAGPAAQALAIGVLVAAVSLAVRWWQTSGRVPGWWNDTGAYDEVSQRSLTSGRFWMAERPPGVPLVMKLVGDPPSYRFMYVNIGAACVAWGWLAEELVRALGAVRLRAVAVGVAVIGLSFASEVILWDSQVLSESLAISLLVGVVAAVLEVLRLRSLPSVLQLLVVAWLWALLRDTNAVTLLVLAAVAGVCVWRFGALVVPRRVAAVAVVGLLAVAGWSMTSAWVGHRDLVPLADVFAARILGYEDRVDWFADHGMPQRDEILEAGRGIGPDSDPRTLELGRHDPKWAEWWRWLRADGKATWVRFIVEHPTYLFAEPLKDPERTYNNSGLTGYAGEMRVVPFADEVFWLPMPLVVVGLGALSAAQLRHRRRPPPVVAVAWTLAGAAALAGFMTWHTGGMETGRHLLVSAFEARLALVLLLLAVLVQPSTEPPAQEPAPV